MTDIKEALRRYKSTQFQSHLDAAESERTKILNRFPLEHWPDMTLEEYALGQSRKDVYSWWLEFGTPHLGSMKGGAASKHNIFKRKNKEWYYRPEFTNENEAWDSLHQAFITMFEYARGSRWDEIDSITGLYGTQSVRVKSLHIYFPENILPIASSTHLQHFLEGLGVPREDRRNLEAVSLNRMLLQKLHESPETRSWTTNAIERFLYWWDDPRKKIRATQIVKIAPGEEGRYWNDCFQNSYIRVGWEKVGDLREYEDQSEFRQAFEIAYRDEYKGNQSTLSKKADEVWTLLGLEPGDKIIANKGISEILGIGTVIEPGYEWLPDLDEYNHIVRVEWDTTHAGKKPGLPDQWRFVTVAPVSQALYQRITSATDKEVAEIPSSPLFGPIADALERKGQVILHGPPGTGKTFHSLRFAEWWLTRENGRTHDPKKTFQAPKRVWWVVANPKQWQWDKLFQDGSVQYRYGLLKRNYALVQEGDLVVGYLAAPAMQIVALARVKEGLTGSGSEAHITLEPVHRIKNGLTFEELTKDSTLSRSEPIRLRCQGTLFKLESEEADYLLSLLAERDPQIQTYIEQTDTIADDDRHLTLITFHPSYSYEDFIEGFRPLDSGDGLRLKLADGVFKSVCTTARANPKRKYLIIVDEINRANLAKVFGEIITLLERDKRGIPVTLPQSKEPFIVPANVYMLGTMNTSDRSIRLMDAALRRRFSFIEIMPDMALLRGAKIEGGLDLYDYLTILNGQISRTHGREKQIGQAFFLEAGQPISSVAEFAQRFRQDVLPLLQEYCYDNYSQLAEYIGDHLVDVDNATLREDVLSNDDKLVSVLVEFISKPKGSV